MLLTICDTCGRSYDASHFFQFHPDSKVKVKIMGNNDIVLGYCSCGGRRFLMEGDYELHRGIWKTLFSASASVEGLARMREDLHAIQASQLDNKSVVDYLKTVNPDLAMLVEKAISTFPDILATILFLITVAIGIRGGQSLGKGDIVITREQKQGDTCTCGSGRKYKWCCSPTALERNKKKGANKLKEIRQAGDDRESELMNLKIDD